MGWWSAADFERSEDELRIAAEGCLGYWCAIHRRRVAPTATAVARISDEYLCMSTLNLQGKGFQHIKDFVKSLDPLSTWSFVRLQECGAEEMSCAKRLRAGHI